MIFFYNSQGTLINLTPEPVYQGSDGATTLYFVAPIVSTAAVNVAFTLPNGIHTKKQPLTPFEEGIELNGVVDNNGTEYKIWFITLDGYVTAYTGDVRTQFYFTVDGITRATESVVFTVEIGVPPVTPPAEGSSYEKIIAYISEIWADFQDEINGKQDTLTTAQQNAVDSGITAEKVTAYDNHIANKNNPHEVTKAQVGLGNVDNTSDLAKPISTATQTALDGKQSKIDSTHKLRADLVDDSTSTNKFVTEDDIYFWDNKQDKIDSSHKLGSNLVDDTNHINKFVTASQISTWNAKQNALTFDTAPTSGSDNPVTSSGIKTAIDNAISSVYKYKGSVSTYADLPSTGLTVGDVYNVESTGDNYAWTGTAWDKLAGTVDLSSYYTKTETNTLLSAKQNEIDSTHKLSADLVDDTNTTNKFVTASEKAQISENEEEIEKIKTGATIVGKSYTSKQLENVSDESGSYQDRPFVLQATGTNSNITDTSTAPIAKQLELRGNTVCFNQLAKLSNAEFPSSEVDVSPNGNGFIINDVGSGITGNGTTLFAISNIPILWRHRYLLIVDVENYPTKASTDVFVDVINYSAHTIIGSIQIEDVPENGRVGKIIYSDSHYSFQTVYLAFRGLGDTHADGQQHFNNTKIVVQMFDLTCMFGFFGYVGTTKYNNTQLMYDDFSLLDFDRLFRLPYYSSDVGTLFSAKANKLVTVDYNQLSGQDEYIKVIAGQTYRLMYWDGTELAPLESGSIEEYNGEKTSIKTTTYNNLSDLHTLDNNYPENPNNNNDVGIKLTDETQYVKIIGSSNTNILFNIAWDGTRSDYKPYVKHEYTLPTLTDELKSAGKIYDSYYANGKIIRRVGSVDLGTLSWNRVYESSADIYEFQANIGEIATRKTTDMFCERYPVSIYGVFNGWSYMENKTIAKAANDNHYIRIRDDSFVTEDELADEANFKASLNGVHLYYELETPTETTGNQSFAENIEVDDFGTMEFVSSLTESASNPIVPQGNRFFYPADYVLFIDDMYKKVNGKASNYVTASQLSSKQDKPTIGEDTASTSVTLAPNPNTEYYFSEPLTALNVTFPIGSTGDLIQINFTAGTGIDVSFGLNVTALDTTFTAGKRYSITAQKDKDLWWLLCVEREINNA